MSTATLEELLVQTHLLSPTQLAVAQRDARLQQQRLAPTLIDLELVEERRFAEWISGVTRVPLLAPITDDQVARLEHRIPRGIAREYEAVPVALRVGELVVAMLNPLDTACLEILREATGLRVSAVVGLHSELTRLLARFYPEDDIDATMLPGNATIASSFLNVEGEAGLETMVARPSAEATNPIPSAPTAALQLDRLEQQLARIVRMIERLDERIGAMETALSRVSRRDE